MKKIEHIGIAVKDLEKSNELFASLFGKSHYKIEEVASEGVKTSFFKSGPNKIELLEATKPDSPIAKFIEKKGEGIHHIAFAVDDIESEVNSYNISMFPNPTTNVLNLKFESNTVSDLNVEIMSIDGKTINTSKLSNYESQQVDISNLSQGVYITNFYSGNVLIASKRLVKN